MIANNPLHRVCKRASGRILILLLALAANPVAGEIRYDQKDRVWNLSSGPVEYRLRQKGDAVYLDYFGPRAELSRGQGVAAKTQPQSAFGGELKDMAGQVEGQSLAPEDMALIEHKITSPSAGVDELLLTFRHRRLRLKATVRYGTWGQTGVFTRRVTLHNEGSQILRVEALPSLSWELPAGPYSLTYLWGGGGHERQVATEPLGPGQRSFGSRSGRSTSSCAAWFSLHNEHSGIRYLAQLAYSGNWQMQFERQHTEAQNVAAQMGIRFDFDGSLALEPGKSFDAPTAAFTATAGDLDDGANQMHRYQRQFVAARSAANQPPLVQFNSWYPFPGTLSVAEMKRYVDAAAASLGVEVFVIDAGWNGQKNWLTELGDWRPNPVTFPKGTAELADYAHAKGMKFGMWVMIEALGVDTQVFKSHPDWCLTYNGQPIAAYGHGQLDFGKPCVRQWVAEAVDRLVQENKLDWLKIDGDDVGNRFDPSGAGRPGDVLHRHVLGYYALLDEIRHKHPKLIIENCSSGGGRFDLETLAHTHTNWISDDVATMPSLQLAYGATLEFIPEVCNHWMVGDYGGTVAPSTSPAWFQFMLRVPMTGQFGISSKILEWPTQLRQLAAEEVRLYKRLRTVIAASDVYHLTPPPPHDSPTGWMAQQYVAEGGRRSVLLAYRLGGSAPHQTFKLRGLLPGEQYHVTQDGQDKGPSSGRQLAEAGLSLDVPEEWRAVVIEIEAEKGK